MTIRITVRIQESEIRIHWIIENVIPIDFDEILWRAGEWPRDQLITYWWRSASLSGSGSPFRITIRIREELPRCQHTEQMPCKNHSAIPLCWRSVEVCALWVCLVSIRFDSIHTRKLMWIDSSDSIRELSLTAVLLGLQQSHTVLACYFQTIILKTRRSPSWVQRCNRRSCRRRRTWRHTWWWQRWHRGTEWSRSNTQRTHNSYYTSVDYNTYTVRQKITT